MVEDVEPVIPVNVQVETIESDVLVKKNRKRRNTRVNLRKKTS